MRENYNFIFVFQLGEKIGSVSVYESEITFQDFKYQIYTILTPAIVVDLCLAMH